MPRKRLNRLKNKEIKQLKKLRRQHPDLYRKCGKYTCCQAMTKDGRRCSRAALSKRTYIHKVKCCLLCWQHALIYGVYGLYKVSQMAVESNYSWDEYCALYPNKCEAYFKTEDKYK